MEKVYDKWCEFWDNHRWAIYTVLLLIVTFMFNYAQLLENHKFNELLEINGMLSIINLFCVTPIIQTIVLLGALFLFWIIILLILRILCLLFPSD